MKTKFFTTLILIYLSQVLSSQTCPPTGDCSYTITKYDANGFGCTGELYVNFNYSCGAYGHVWGTDYLGNAYDSYSLMIFVGHWELLPGDYQFNFTSSGPEGSCESEITSFSIGQPVCDFDLNYEINPSTDCNLATLKIWCTNQGCTDIWQNVDSAIYVTESPLIYSAFVSSGDTLSFSVEKGTNYNFTLTNALAYDSLLLAPCSQTFTINIPHVTCSFTTSVTSTNITEAGLCANGKLKVMLGGTYNCYPHLSLYDNYFNYITEAFPPVGASSYTFTNLNSGTYHIDVDDGYSCTQTLSSQVKCPKPQSGLTTTNITSNSAKAKWSTVSCTEGYKLQYRKIGTPGWTTTNTTTPGKLLTGLLPSTNYEWKVSNQCIGSEPDVYSPYSNLQTFTTLPLKTGEQNNLGEQFSIEISPNPSIGIYKVETKNITSTPINIQILNSMGYNIPADIIIDADGIINIDISSQPSGIYIIRFEYDTETATERLIKQ